jgi:hypothetical protein
VGSAPFPALGFAAGAGYRTGRFSVGGELRVDLPSPSVEYAGAASAASTTPTSASLSSFLILGTLLPCVHLSVAFGCAAISGGVLTASASGIAHETAQRAPYAAAGPRVGVEIPVSRRFGFRASVDVGFPFVRNDFGVEGGTPYAPPPVWVALALGGAYHF